jgi:hypothetical protein
MNFSIFEIIMLLCFGAAWPVSIYKSWKSRTNAGKSLLFLWVIFCGYLAGITHKIVYARDPVLVLYICNALMIAADLGLYYRNRRIAAAENQGR